MKVWIARVLPVFMIGFAVGCGRPTAPETLRGPAASNPTANHKSEHGHEHGHGAGPHEGTLLDWGGGAYHLEFTVDHGKKEATVYLLGSDEKSAAPIKADKIKLVINDPPTEMELTAKPLDGEEGGKSSRFVGTHDTLGIVKEFAGTISGEIEGTPYTGDFKEEPHGEHNH